MHERYQIIAISDDELPKLWHRDEVEYRGTRFAGVPVHPQLPNALIYEQGAVHGRIHTRVRGPPYVKAQCV